MKYYTSTQYKDLTADRLGEGHDWFRIKVGDYVVARDQHDLSKNLDNQESLVTATDRKTVTFRDKNTGQYNYVDQDRIYRVARYLKTKTIKAIFPANWSSADLRACEYRKNGKVETLRIADLELHLKTSQPFSQEDGFDGEKAFQLIEGSSTTKYGSKEDRIWVQGYIGKDGWCDAISEGGYVSREEHHWVDACVKVIANIY